MTIHKSLKSKDVLKRQRNVLSRWERVVSMREQETWQDGRSAYGLPKVKVQVHRKRVKVKKEVTEDAAAAEVTETSETSAPAGTSSTAKT